MPGDSFFEEMAGVQPLKQDKADVGKRLTSDASVNKRREAAIAITEEENHLSTSHVKELAPYDVVAFKRDGVQEGVFRKLRLGKYASEARLDLHRMTIEQSRKAIFDFIKDAMTYELRTVMILHGKGDRQETKKAVLKSYTVHWLMQIDEVMAFHSAQPQHGGTGALYVLLRKSDEAKSRNRERHGVRS